MDCAACGGRKAKRACPALDRHICAVCCGTKRLVEIACPPDCPYLATSRSHPPAIVQRQRDYDQAHLLPLLRGLSERQARLFLLCAAAVAGHRADELQTLRDEDIGQASGAMAATLETAGRGIVYEHKAASRPAERLLEVLKPVVAEVTREGGSGLERDTAIALRRIEFAANAAAGARPEGTEFHELLVRMLSGPGNGL